MPYRTHQNINYIVQQEVNKQLQPNFLEILLKHHHFLYELDRAVESKLPKVVQKTLSRNTDLVSTQVQLQLPNILSNQHYYLNALNQQNEHFKQLINEQQNEYISIHKEHLVNLYDASRELISNSISKVTNQDHMLQQINKNIEVKSKKNIDKQYQSFESKLEQEKSYLIQKIQWYVAGAVVLGSLFGSVISIATISHYNTYLL